MSYKHQHEIHCRLKNALLTEAQLRKGRPVGEWIAERQLMLALVNEERERRNKEPLTVAYVERVEQLAVGHVDYAHKFALYCSELVEETLQVSS